MWKMRNLVRVALIANAEVPLLGKRREAEKLADRDNDEQSVDVT